MTTSLIDTCVKGAPLLNEGIFSNPSYGTPWVNASLGGHGAYKNINVSNLTVFWRSNKKSWLR